MKPKEKKKKTYKVNVFTTIKIKAQDEDEATLEAIRIARTEGIFDAEIEN